MRWLTNAEMLETVPSQPELKARNFPDLHSIRLFYTFPATRRLASTLWNTFRSTEYPFFDRHSTSLDILHTSFPDYVRFILFQATVTSMKELDIKFDPLTAEGYSGVVKSNVDAFVKRGGESVRRNLSIEHRNVEHLNTFVFRHVRVDQNAREQNLSRFFGPHWRLEERYYAHIEKLFREGRMRHEAVVQWAASRREEIPGSDTPRNSTHYYDELHAELHAGGHSDLAEIARDPEQRLKCENLVNRHLGKFLASGELTDELLIEARRHFQHIKHQRTLDTLTEAGCWPPPADQRRLYRLSTPLQKAYIECAREYQRAQIEAQRLARPPGDARRSRSRRQVAIDNFVQPAPVQLDPAARNAAAALWDKERLSMQEHRAKEAASTGPSAGFAHVERFPHQEFD